MASLSLADATSTSGNKHPDTPSWKYTKVHCDTIPTKSNPREPIKTLQLEQSHRHYGQLVQGRFTLCSIRGQCGLSQTPKRALLL